ncbi:MAG: NPCBM/NEW2 domain-containing protein [Enterocloster asparagiformis]|nr:NPCBM/NEW2 domain-containing protein [Enterocloster asparagiformis]
MRIKNLKISNTIVASIISGACCLIVGFWGGHAITNQITINTSDNGLTTITKEDYLKLQAEKESLAIEKEQYGAALKEKEDKIVELSNDYQKLYTEKEAITEQLKAISNMQETISTPSNQTHSSEASTDETVRASQEPQINDNYDLLLNMTPFHDISQAKIKHNVTDRLGNSFATALVFDTIILKSDNDKNMDNALEYNLAGQYSKMSCTLAFSDKKSKHQLYMMVYVDGKLAFTSPVFDEKTKPQTFDFSIDNADFIEILVAAADGNYGNAGALIISDVKLFR